MKNRSESEAQFQEMLPGVDPAAWTAIVPAAGRGSRLGFDKPKILFPVAGKPILDWLLGFLLPTCSRIIFVLSPDGRPFVEQYLHSNWKQQWDECRFGITVQEVPTGMGDAIEIGLHQVATPFTAIVWGDQVALKRESVETCLRLQAGPQQPDLTFPTVLRDQPYIHFGRDGEGKITSLLQAREGDPMPAVGESDTGFFCFRTDALRSLLSSLRHSSETAGRGTGEFNFLPVILLAAKQGRTILTPHVVSIEETMGVNSREDALQLDSYLRSYACLP